MNTLTLREFVQSLRDAARIKLQMLMVSDLLVNISQTTKTINNLEKEVETVKKDIERNNYKISKLDETNPDFKEFKETLKENNEKAEQAIEDLMKETTKYNKDIINLEDKIEKVTKGEIKVSLNEVNKMVNEELSTTKLEKFVTKKA